KDFLSTKKARQLWEPGVEVLYSQRLAANQDGSRVLHHGVESLENGPDMSREAGGRRGDAQVGLLRLLLTAGVGDELEDVPDHLERGPQPPRRVGFGRLLQEPGEGLDEAGGREGVAEFVLRIVVD